jgi:hypothetical protein
LPDVYSRLVPVFVAVGVITGVGLILFALRPGPWVFNITEESLRTPPGRRYHREWWSEAELERRSRPLGDQAKDLIDWTAVGGHAARLRSHTLGRDGGHRLHRTGRPVAAQ